MLKISKAKVGIDPEYAKKILNELNRRCLQAVEAVGEEMGFSLDSQSFYTEIAPGKTESIEFVFRLNLFQK